MFRESNKMLCHNASVLCKNKIKDDKSIPGQLGDFFISSLYGWMPTFTTVSSESFVNDKDTKNKKDVKCREALRIERLPGSSSSEEGV